MDIFFETMGGIILPPDFDDYRERISAISDKYDEAKGLGLDFWHTLYKCYVSDDFAGYLAKFMVEEEARGRDFETFICHPNRLSYSEYKKMYNIVEKAARAIMPDASDIEIMRFINRPKL